MQFHCSTVRILILLSLFILDLPAVAATQSNSIRLRALIIPRAQRFVGSSSPKPKPSATASLAFLPAAATNAIQVAVRYHHWPSYYYSRSVCAHTPPTAFGYYQQRQILRPASVQLYLNRRKRASITTMVQNGDNQLLVAHNITSILLTSVQSLGSTNEVHDQKSLLLRDATQLVHNLKYRANSFCVKELTSNTDVLIQSIEENSDDDNQHFAQLQLLSDCAISAVESLRELVHYVNTSPTKGKKSRQGSKQSSGRAWKALETVVSSSLGFNELNVLDTNGNIDVEISELSITLAVLALGIALSINSTDPAITRMIASAVLPSDEIHRGKRYQKFVSSKTGAARIHVHSMARSATLILLRLAIDTSIRSSNNKSGTVDMQIVAKIESGFCVGCIGRSLNDGKQDAELAVAVAGIVDNVLKLGKNGDENYSNGDGDEPIISKDVFAPTLPIIANSRPWEYVEVEKLARIAAEMDLWYAAEKLCDAVMETGDTLQATLDGLALALPHLPAAQLTAQTILDIAFDRRLYRRADGLATKYYSFVGPERYAEARFLHACDTIEKLIKKRQAQIIDRQVELVDEVVAKVSTDLASVESTKTSRFQGEDIAIETMGDRIREFSLRRLRASNMHTTAERLAKLWRMTYSHDPIQMRQELERRKMMYLQWNDDGCPGSSCRNYKSGSLSLPQLISSPSDLLEQFAILQSGTETIGFDCEWHDSINFVALLQLSTTTNSWLLDIPALTMTKEGCDALRCTVGALFSRSNRRLVVGFSCKDDIRRLRASPCVSTSTHWFPQKDYELNVRDLRHMVAEISPRLDNGRGLQNFGLSRLCEVFLGKQLDKAEQCSDWLIRPLSPEQIEYAALDAWACAAIQSKIQIMDAFSGDSVQQVALSECN